MGACVGSGSNTNRTNQSSNQPRNQAQNQLPPRAAANPPNQQPIYRNPPPPPPPANRNAPKGPIPLTSVESQDRVHLEVYLRKNSFELVPVPQQAGNFSLTFEFDSLCVCIIDIYYFAVENLDQLGKNTLNFSVDTKMFPIPQSYRFNAGMKQKFPPNVSLIIPSKYPPDLLQFKNKIHIPIVVNIRNEDKTNMQTQTCFLAIENEGGNYKLSILKQKISIRQKWFILNEIYNLEKSEGECVICLGDKCTVTALPCKHCCLCVICSEMIRNDPQMKCPVCRAKVEKFVNIEFNE
ncbi:unnamed protein product [Blepharisma stoltei]|uniref:RING-type E3 ubiquitin transferase n=1 Tax=Blepharisma stoltei TaxID=1481888 RepID=A0AAU9JZ41_9CILI|nr:unnamed protein product [Blepharisma stoltei]